MKKKVLKSSTKHDQYTAVLEDLRSHFKVFGESLDGVGDEIKEFKEEMTEFKEETRSNFKTVFNYLSKIDNEIKEIKEEIKNIRRDLLNKAEVARVDKLELRVVYLEKELAKR